MLENSEFVHPRPRPPGDPELPGADTLVSPARLTEIAHALTSRSGVGTVPAVAGMDIRIESVRYKPGTKLAVSFSFAVSGSPSRSRAVALSLPRSRFEETLEKTRERVPEDQQWADSESCDLAWLWPGDRELPGLSRLTPGREGARFLRRAIPELAHQDARLRSASVRVDLLRYKPERRAVALFRGLVKESSGNKRLVRFVVRVMRPDGPWPVWPEIPQSSREVARDPRAGLRIETFLCGLPLLRHLEGPGASDGGPETLLALGRDVAGLHAALSAHPGDRDQQVDPVTGAAEARRLLGSVCPGELEERFDHLARVPAPDSATVALHGDLHPGQILIDPAGTRFVDLDCSVRGAPARDLGQLVFALERRLGRVAGIRQAVLTGYAEAGGAHIDARDLAYWVAREALARVASPLRNLHPEGTAHAQALMDTAEKELTGAMARS